MKALLMQKDHKRGWYRSADAGFETDVAGRIR
jgi:hypothetical protein